MQISSCICSNLDDSVIVLTTPLTAQCFPRLVHTAESEPRTTVYLCVANKKSIRNCKSEVLFPWVSKMKHVVSGYFNKVQGMKLGIIDPSSVALESNKIHFCLLLLFAIILKDLEPFTADGVVL